MRKVSKKLAKANAEYVSLRRKFLEENPMCHAKLDKCTLYSTEVHHSRGRGEYLLVVSTWKPLCRYCHDWAEHNPLEAIELGLSESRLNK